MKKINRNKMKIVRHKLKKIGQKPKLKKPVDRLWNTYEHIKFVSYIYKNSYFNCTNESASVNPFLIYWVDPHMVKASSASSFDFIKDTGRILSGDWDQNPKQIINTPRYHLFQQRFENGVPWEETEFYQRRVERVSQDQGKRYTTLRELKNKMETYDYLYKQFENGNYMLQSELVKREKESALGEGGQALVPSLTNSTLMRHEIAVNIGRDGTFLRNDGRHRIALAQLTDLSEVPVRIVVRHAEWQRLRNKVAKNIDDGIKKDIPAEKLKKYVRNEVSGSLNGVHHGLDHPDLEEIFENKKQSLN